jgi:hypothetical protein
VGAGGFDGAHGVGEDAAVIIRGRVEQAAGHEAGVLRVAAGGLEVGRVAGLAVAALAARVHDQVGIAGAGPQQGVDGEAAPAAVADVLHHAGELARAALGGQQQPAFDGLAAITVEGDVEDFERAQPGVIGRKARVERVGARLGQGGVPEAVEVGGLVARRQVGLELVERQVEEWH